jgi:hypothetical protein
VCGQRLRTRSSWRGKCGAQTNLLTLHSGARELAGKRGGHCTCELLQKSFDRLTAIICDRSLCTMSEAPGASVSHDSLPRCFRPAGGWLRRAPDRSSSRSGSGSGPSAAAPSSGAPPRSTHPTRGRETRDATRGHADTRDADGQAQTDRLQISHRLTSQLRHVLGAPVRSGETAPEDKPWRWTGKSRFAF